MVKRSPHGWHIYSMTNLVSVIILESPSHVKDSENISRKRRQRERSARHPGGSPPRAVSQKRRQPRTRLEARRTGRTRSRRRPLRAVGRWERARVQRLRAGSGHQRSPPPDAPPGPPPSCGIARRRDGRGARVAGRRRERPARGRTRMPAVVPQLARSYPDARGRTLDLPQGTTWHRKVRPREPTYDRASPRTTARRSGRQPNSAPAEGPPTHGSRAPEATHRRGTRPRS